MPCRVLVVEGLEEIETPRKATAINLTAHICHGDKELCPSSRAHATSVTHDGGGGQCEAVLGFCEAAGVGFESIIGRRKRGGGDFGDIVVTIFWHIEISRFKCLYTF